MTQPINRSLRALLKAQPTLPPAFRPPGSQGEAEFIAQCTRCDACINRCPEQIIRRGDGGFPELHFDQSGCTFCGECIGACEPGALQLPQAQKPQRLARINNDCLALQAVTCQSCGDSCDTRAIRFTLSAGHVPRPTLALEHCTGCGFCVGVCPASAITLQSIQEGE